MSWSPNLCIGEFRPWPESIYVTRDKTDETRRYVPEKFSSAMECLRYLENAALRELVRDMYDNYRAGWNEEIEDELSDRMRALGIEVDV